ncbi:hypothetical protein CHUAL_008380 [Chamberlinius hualienensis]
MVLPQGGEKCGYLNVKVPAKVRGKGVRGWKAWKRKWVVVHAMTVQATKDPIVTIDMYSNENRQGQLERSTVYLEKVTVIHRTLSRSHHFAFTVEAAVEPLIHLAGKSETDSQSWISALRNIFWPPIIRAPLGGGIGTVFEVSIIESVSARMATSGTDQPVETVGYMMVLPSVILLTSLASGSILIEWPWMVIRGVRLINTDNDEDKEKIIAVHVISNVATSGLYYLFSKQAESIHQMLTDRLEEIEAEDDSCFVNGQSQRQSLNSHRNSTISQRRLSMSQGQSSANRKSLLSQRQSTVSRKSSLDSSTSRKSGKIQQKTLTTSSSSTDDDDDDDDDNQHIINKSQSLNSIATNEEVETPDIESSEPEVEFQVQLRRKIPFKTSAGTVIYDKIPKPRQCSKLDRRKSISDTDILTEIRRSKEDQKRHRSSSSAIVSKTATGSSKSIKMKQLQKQKELSVPKIQYLKPEMAEDKRPMSIHSAGSSMSRDSGVMMSPTDETITLKNSLQVEETISKQFYRPFADFVDERAVQLSTRRQSTSSTTSEGTIYSEIDQVNGGHHEDPLYEDLDKFRKNIHKLLGVSKGEMSDNCKTPPPPLPPRQYEGGRPVTPVMPVQLHRKDVLKYLGVESEGKTKKFYGSLNRLPTGNVKSNQKFYQINKRKDIHSFLGISPMTSSQPSLVELTYDQPRPTFDLINTAESTVNNSTTTNKNNNNSSNCRRISKSYVRVRKSEDSSTLALPSSTQTLSSLSTSPKPLKKKKIKFPKWRRLSTTKSPEEISYRSFDQSDLDLISIEADNVCSSVCDVPELDQSLSVMETPIEEEVTTQNLDEQAEQCSVPKLRKSAITNDIPPAISLSIAAEPQYANLIDMQENPQFLLNDNELIEDDEYTDMSIRAQSLRHAHSLYIAMETETEVPATLEEMDANTIAPNYSKVRKNSKENVDVTEIEQPVEICTLTSEEHDSSDNSSATAESAVSDKKNDETVAITEIPTETSSKNVENLNDDVKSDKTTETHMSTADDVDKEVIKRMIIESNTYGDRLKKHLSSYIDEIFAESLMEFDSRRSSNISNSSTKSMETE